MLERLNKPGFETISIPDAVAVSYVKEILAHNTAPLVAEIGIGIGATSVALCEALANQGALHLYDFEGRAADVVKDLEALGFHNVVAYENSRRHWDSYNWQLMRRLEENPEPIYDFIYLDGAHTWFHDALAFLLCDRLLKPGGYIHFDDYFWRLADSKWLLTERDALMTREQIETRQVELIVKLLVDRDPRYENVRPYKVYRKRA
ncbi:MAG: class I SAM-dependent methyltransferase [Hyphomonadaceae bacterium]